MQQTGMNRYRSFQQQSRKAASRHTQAFARTIDSLGRHRPLWMTQFAVSQADLSEGLRAAFASTLMLLLGNLLHRPEFSWAAIGAFWTCLADAAGSNRRRFASMTAFALLSTLCGGLTAVASGAGIVAAAMAILLFASFGALGRIWGAAAGQVAILAATACVVMVDRPVHASSANFEFVGVYFGGCVFATVLSFTVWRIHPFGNSRAAARATYLRLSDMARDSARLLKHRRDGFNEWASHAARFRSQTRIAIEATRQALERVPVAKADRQATYEELVLALAGSEQIFAYLIAVTDVCERGIHRLTNPRRVARALDAFADVLARQARAIAERSPESASRLQSRMLALARSIDAALGEPISLRFDIDVTGLDAPSSTQGSWRSVAALALREGIETLKANASLESIGARHAARVGVAATVAFITVRLLHLSFGYWATMATLLILQPSIAGSWPRSVERAVGSVIGGLMAAGIGLLVHSPIAISLLVFPLVCATMALRPVSYSLFVLFITPTFVLVADFAAPGGAEALYAITRLENNVLGCVIALLATFLLWPSREPNSFDRRLAEAVAANLNYLGLSFGISQDNGATLERLRRAAGLASNNAEEVLARLRLEKLETSHDDRTRATALALLRRVAGTATRARFSQSAAVCNEGLAAWIQDIAAHLEAHTVPDSPDTYDKNGLTLLQADAVNQVVLLRRLLGDS